MRQHFFFKLAGSFVLISQPERYFTIAELIDSRDFYSQEGLPFRERNLIPGRAPTCLLAASERHREILLDFPALHKCRSKA